MAGGGVSHKLESIPEIPVLAPVFNSDAPDSAEVSKLCALARELLESTGPESLRTITFGHGGGFQDGSLGKVDGRGKDGSVLD